jgi:hypothetical protein
MKICHRCKLEKSLDQFNKSAKNADGKHSYCRECSKQHYQSNKETHLENVARVRLARKQLARDLIVSRLQVGCIDCGILDIRVLEFDHITDAKIDGVGRMVSRGFTLDKIALEMDKCEIRCRNCHAIKTYERIGTTWHDSYLRL